MSAFKGALEAGAHALETDIHLSKDGVVVLSHVLQNPPLIFSFPVNYMRNIHIFEFELEVSPKFILTQT